MFDVQEGLEIDHQYDRSPGVPRPLQPILLRVSAPAKYQAVAVVALPGAGAPPPDEILRRGSVYPARRTGSHWEAVLPGMADGTIVHYVVRAADANGQFAYADGRRPGHAASVFAHRVTSRRPPDWARNAVIYQIFVDRFADASGPVTMPPTMHERAGGDLHGVRAHLPYLADLGVNTLWLTPVFQATSYHGYDTEDFGRVDPRIGGDEALAAVITDAHDSGIRVLLDLVPNHVSDHHPWFVAARDGGPTRDWFTFDESGAYASFFSNPGMPKLDLDHPEARAAVIDAARYWLEEFGVDGYRIDHVLGPSESFFAAFATALNRSFPDAWLFGEATATPAFVRRYGGLMDGATDFLTAYALRDYFAGELLTAGLVEVEQEAAAVLPHDDFTWVRFFDNHDMDRGSWVWNDDGARITAAVALLTSIPGVPAILYGTEQGASQNMGARDHGLAVSRTPMRFDDRLGVLAPIRAALQQRRARGAATAFRWVPRPEGFGWERDDTTGFLPGPAHPGWR
jgi:glycosidase